MPFGATISCTTRAECVPEPATRNAGADLTAAGANKQQLKWISTDSAAKCIELQSVVPDKIPMTSTGKVSIRQARSGPASTAAGWHLIERAARRHKMMGRPRERQYDQVFATDANLILWPGQL